MGKVKELQMDIQYIMNVLSAHGEQKAIEAFENVRNAMTPMSEQGDCKHGLNVRDYDPQTHVPMYVDTIVDEVEGDELGWCCDCQLNSVIETAQLEDNAKVIGFQVVGEDGTQQEGEIHPHMDGSFCVYSLSQARAMLDDDNQGDEQWRLLTIWEGDIEEPTMMFRGDPRN